MEISEMIERGREAYARVFGQKAQVVRAAPSAFARDLTEHGDYCMGAVWGRPGLDTRTRRFITMAIFAAQNPEHAARLLSSAT